ncbi:MAG: glyoxalase [Lachnospiraceae bacterium]|nr:glyoxalase [Lachnospiraceae bacterium]
MEEYSYECLMTFLDMQDRLFDEPVAQTPEEAEAFLWDCMAEVVDSLDDVRDYLDQMGMDTQGMTDLELEEASEVFPLPSGGYLIVGA